MALARRIVLVVAILALVAPAAWTQQAPVPIAPGETITLQATLEKGLRCKTPEEFKYIEKISRYVENGKISRELVLSTFDWARDKPKNQVRYFDRGLRERAKALGVSLPSIENVVRGSEGN
ncbi:MAG TPA: hypothetical protein VGE52_10985 [Pirellulales bacterium]